MVQVGGGKRVLMVGSEGIVLFAPAGTGVIREASIAWEVPNFEEQLSEALGGRNASKSVVIVYDGGDQLYRKEENIPKLSPFDKPRFVKRKLELAFPSYPIRASLEIKPQVAKKKGLTLTAPPYVPASYLFVALPETEQLDRIADAILQSGSSVAGVGFLPVETAEMVTEVTNKAFSDKTSSSRWRVIIGQHETGGLRQVVVKDGNLAITRLTPPTDAGISGAGWVEDVIREFKATLTYITRFGYTPADGLDIVVVCGEIEKQLFDQRDMGSGRLKCLTVSEAIQFLGAKVFGFDKSNYADAVHALWCSKRNTLKLPINIPSIHKIMLPRLAARGVSFLLGVSMLVLGYMCFDSYQSYSTIASDLEQRESQRAVLSREYEEESKIFNELPVKPEIIKLTMATKKSFEENTVDLKPTFHTLKRVFGDDIWLKNLSFKHEPEGILKGGTSASPGISFGTEQVNPRGKVTINFSFGLPSDIPLEDKVTRAEELQKTLREAFPGYDVKITRQFGNVSREGSLKGTTAGSQAAQPSQQDEQADFELSGVPL